MVWQRLAAVGASGGACFFTGDEVVVDEIAVAAEVIGEVEVVVDIAVDGSDGDVDLVGFAGDVCRLAVGGVVEVEDVDLLLLVPHPAAAMANTATTQAVAAPRLTWEQ